MRVSEHSHLHTHTLYGYSLLVQYNINYIYWYLRNTKFTF
jgi:hypothetical protein